MRNGLVDYLKNADRVLIFTGAGISTNSGIPDFRGPQGVWQNTKPVYYQDFMSSEAARREYWEYKLGGFEAFDNAEPNSVHESMVKLEKAGKLEKIVTQNIDGLHSKAGTSPEKIVEMHGSNREIECQSCGKRSDPENHFKEFKKTNIPPDCDCGGYLKPATISFGQNLREQDIKAATESAGNADLVIALGTTLSVYPAASITLLAARMGAPYVIINRGLTEHDDKPEVSLRLEGDVSDIFPPAVDGAC